MEDKNNGFIGVFRKCSVCGAEVLCTLDSDTPETHNKKCKEKLKKDGK